jgi:hypothetical protein
MVARRHAADCAPVVGSHTPLVRAILEVTKKSLKLREVVDIELPVDFPHVVDDRAFANAHQLSNIGMRASEQQVSAELPLAFAQASLKSSHLDSKRERWEMLSVDSDTGVARSRRCVIESIRFERKSTCGVEPFLGRRRGGAASPDSIEIGE